MDGPGISIRRFGRARHGDFGDILQRDNLHDTLSLITEFAAVHRREAFSGPQILHANIWRSPTACRLPVWPKGSPDEIRGGRQSSNPRPQLRGLVVGVSAFDQVSPRDWNPAW